MDEARKLARTREPSAPRLDGGVSRSTDSAGAQGPEAPSTYSHAGPGRGREGSGPGAVGTWADSPAFSMSSESTTELVLVARDGPPERLLLHDLVALLVLHLGIPLMGLHLHHLVCKVGKRGQKEEKRHISTQARRRAAGSLGRRGGTMDCPWLAWPGPGSADTEQSTQPRGRWVQAWTASRLGLAPVSLKLGPTAGPHTGLPREKIHPFRCS